MNLRHLISILSVFGISATFMPWLHFPKSNTALYGYVGDGVVSGIIFTIIGILSYPKKKNQIISNAALFFITTLSGLMAWMSYSKLVKIEADKVNFSSDNPLLSGAFAGVHQGIGVYVVGFAGISILFLSSILGYLKVSKKVPFNEIISGLESKKKKYLATILIGIVGLMCYFIWQTSFSSSNITDNQLKANIEESVNEMGKALIRGDYATFVGYNHLEMQQSMGGSQNLTDLVKSTMDGMKTQGTTIQSITLGEVINHRRKGKQIQALISQKVVLSDSTGSRTEIQKLLAISEDNGSSWRFINISNKTKEEIKKNFSFIMDELEF